MTQAKFQNTRTHTDIGMSRKDAEAFDALTGGSDDEFERVGSRAKAAATSQGLQAPDREVAAAVAVGTLAAMRAYGRK